MKTKAIVTFAVAAALAPAAARADCHFMRCRALAEAFADSWNAAARYTDNASSVFRLASTDGSAGEKGGPRAEATQESRPATSKDAIRAAAATKPLWEHFHATGKLLEPSGRADARVNQQEISDLFKTGALHESVYAFNPKKIKFRPLPGQKFELAEWNGELTLAGKKVKNRVYALFVKVGPAEDDWRFDTVLMVPR